MLMLILLCIFSAQSTMLKFVNKGAYLGCYVCLFLLLKALKPLMLNVRALIILNK